MAQNLQIDPVTRDYVLQNGSPIPSDRVLEATYFALLIPQNNWLYGQTGQGSLIYTLEGQKRDASVEQSFAAYAKDAVQRQVIDTGKAQAVQVTNLSTSRSGSSNQVSVIPNQTQLSNQLNFVSV
jgi:phage gp46-like protein